MLPSALPAFSAPNGVRLVPSFGRLVGGYRRHHLGGQQAQGQYTGMQKNLRCFHSLVVLVKSCSPARFAPGRRTSEVHAEAERDEVAIVHGGVLAVEEVGVGEARGVGVLVLRVHPRLTALRPSSKLAPGPGE